MKVYFVTGTDTGIGKTTVACALLAKAAQDGLTTLGLKPVVAGCEETPDGLRNEDALKLQVVSTLKLGYSEINPVALAAPLSPHLAAQAAGKRLSVRQLSGYVRASLSHRPQLALVEGAGGWRVPISERELFSAFPKDMGIPVILVVGLRLGCLNHALLTTEAILKDGLRLAGWVGNRIDPDMTAVDENIATLRQWLPAPCLGILDYHPDADPFVLAALLDLTAILS